MMPLYPNSSLGNNMQQPLGVSLKGPDLPMVSDYRELDQMATQSNSRYAKFDTNDDVFYIVETNENNFKTIRRFRFYEDPIPKPEDNFATKQEMQELRGGLADVQLAIQELTNIIKSNIPQYDAVKYPKSGKQHNNSGKSNVPNGQEQFKPGANVSTNGNEQSGNKSSLQSNPS